MELDMEESSGSLLNYLPGDSRDPVSQSGSFSKGSKLVTGTIEAVTIKHEPETVEVEQNEGYWIPECELKEEVPEPWPTSRNANAVNLKELKLGKQFGLPVSEVRRSTRCFIPIIPVKAQAKSKIRQKSKEKNALPPKLKLGTFYKRVQLIRKGRKPIGEQDVQKSSIRVRPKLDKNKLTRKRPVRKKSPAIESDNIPKPETRKKALTLKVKTHLKKVSKVRKSALRIQKKRKAQTDERPKIKVEKIKGPIICEPCGKTFTRNSGLVYHNKQVHKIGAQLDRKFKCTECEKSFIKQSHLRDHKQVHTKESLYPCRHCEASFNGHTGRRLHEQGMHGVGQKPEEVEKVLDPNRSQRARYTHKSKAEKTCSVCGKEFPTPSLLVSHMRSHTGEKPFQCSTCGCCFKKVLSLQEHIKAIHSGIRDLLCSFCGEGFSRKMSLVYHVKARHGDKRFKCEFEGCGREFVQKAQFKRHGLIHNSRRPFQCKLCNKCFPSVDELTQHASFHKDGGRARKPYKRPSTGPRRIRKTPAPERKFKCSHCEKMFPYRNELWRHEKLHSKDREFKCDICGKGFVVVYYLNYHMKKKHPGAQPDTPLLEPVECQICGKEVQGPARLEIHMKSKHVSETATANAEPIALNTPARKSAKPKKHSKTNIVPDTPSDLYVPQAQNLVFPNSNGSIPQAFIPQDLRYGASSSSVPKSQKYANPATTVPQSFIPQPQKESGHPNPNLMHGHPYMAGSQYQAQDPNSHYAPPQVYGYPYSAQILDSNFGGPNLFPSSYLGAGPSWPTHQHQPVEPEPYIPPVSMDDLREDYSNDYSDLIAHSSSQDDDIGFSEQDHETDQDMSQDGSYYQPPVKEPEPAAAVRQRKPRKAGKTPKRKPRDPNKPKAKPRGRVWGPKIVIPPCAICGKQFSTNQHLKDHQKVHLRSPKPEYPCGVCGKVLKSSYRLEVHSIMHDLSLKPYKCNLDGCDAAFRGSNAVRKHRKEAHPESLEAKGHVCAICNENFLTIHCYRTHMRRHGEKKYKCTTCGLSCVTMSSLNRHMNTHLEAGARIRPHKCPKCEKSYLRAENLVQHMDSIHPPGPDQADGNGPARTERFVCPKCPKEFTLKWKLKAHDRFSHRENKPPPKKVKPLFNTCLTCEWEFDSRVALRQHMKKHAKKDMALECPVCDEVYYLLERVMAHVTNQHDSLTPEQESKMEEMTQKAKEKMTSDSIEKSEKEARRRKPARPTKIKITRVTRSKRLVAVESEDESDSS